MDRVRCGWCGTDPLYVAYHDSEWGVPLHDDRALFDPGSHEPLTQTPWDVERAGSAIRAIVTDTERAFSAGVRAKR